MQTTGFVNAENLNPPFTWSLGLLQMDFFYRKKSWYAGQFMRKITPKAEIKNKINSHTAHYFTTLLNALKRPLLSVLVRDIDKTFREQKIQLPLKPTAKTQTLEDIDFTFMEKFIAELEQCRLAELQAYLKATGLENTTLSSDEENALNVFNGNHSGGNTPCGLTWQSFKLGDLFEMERGTRLTKANRIKGTRPLVTAGYENYGVAEYISNHDQKVFKGNTITIDMFANAFYRYSEYSADDNILVLTPKFTMSYRIGLCVTARINAVLKAKFSYGKQYRQKDFNVTIISLPLKPTANAQTLKDIDFDFMHTLINALMKQTIQGVVQYCSAKIQATKEVISQETPVQKDSLF
ncbi:restriction endonuclease subunit S [Helicobacter pylori]